MVFKTGQQTTGLKMVFMFLKDCKDKQEYVIENISDPWSLKYVLSSNLEKKVCSLLAAGFRNYFTKTKIWAGILYDK